jgi:hypothetical protein
MAQTSETDMAQDPRDTDPIANDSVSFGAHSPDSRDPAERLLHGDSLGLSGMFDPEPPGAAWGSNELGAVLHHQLTGPLALSLASLADHSGPPGVRPAGEAPDIVTLDPQPQNLSDLLRHPSPPPELLARIARLCKCARRAADPPLPPAVSAVLYFTSIATALLRCDRKVTKLSNDALRDGLAWVVGRTWVDDATRSLCADALLHESLRGAG